MNVRRYMQDGAVTALPTAALSVVRKVMDDHGFGLLLVASEEGKLCGFVTRASLKGVTDWDQPVEKVSHPARFAVSPDDTLEKAALILLENRLVLLPVTQGDGHLVGVLTQAEVLRGLAEGLGIGLEGTRLTVKLRDGSDDLYEVLDALRAQGVDLVSLTSGSADGDRREAILRVRGVGDRDELRDDLEQRLRATAA
jgi:acetoin utilization protein AcuB